jgi:hypothetical protein
MPRIDYGSITGPVSRSMDMVASEMLRAPAVRYRLEQERARLQSQNALDSVRAEDYRASARKTNAEAEDVEGRNASKAWLQANDQTFSSLVDAGTVTTQQLNEFARHYARATGKDMKDTMDGLVALAQARKAVTGGQPAEIGAMTGTGAASIAGAGIRAQASKDVAAANNASREKVAGMRDEGYETTTTVTPGTESTPEIPAKFGMFGRKVAEAIPAKAGTPEKRVTVRRKLNSAADLAVPFGEQTMEGDEPELEPQMDADERGLETGTEPVTSAPAVDKEALIAEANDAIKRGAPRDKVLARLKDQFGITVQ